MSNLLFSLKRRFYRFHRNESGQETLQVILILALAAIAAIAVYHFGAQAVQFARDCLHGFPGEPPEYPECCP